MNTLLRLTSLRDAVRTRRRNRRATSRGIFEAACLESLEVRRLLSTTVATFEGLGVPANSFENNAGEAGAFVDEGNAFNNNFSSDFGGIWSGWALSTMTDTTTPGFTNQYSAITGSGADGSQTYAVAFTFGDSADPFHPADSFVNLAAGATPESIQVTNTTYPYLSMLNGDLFEPKFGSGDYLLLTIDGFTGPNGTGTKVGEVDFYLANFLGSNAYIVNTWQNVDLSSLAGAQSLQFGLESSQNDAMFGMNVPAFFAVDNLTETLPSPKSITISPADPSVASGLTEQFTATGTYEDGSTQDLTNEVTWSSDTQSVATISNGGLATGVTPGTSTITASLDGVSASTRLTVSAPVLSSLTISPTAPTVADGLTKQFTATGTYSDKSTKDLTSSVDWSSATESVATITSSGLASGVAVGTSTISASLDGVSASTTLTVSAPVLAALTITPSDPSIANGLTTQFTATGTYTDKSTKDLTSSVDWSSATQSVATITSSGLASGVAVGTSTITAALDGISASTTLTVTAPVLASLTISPADPTVADGLTEQFTATGTYSDKSTKDLTSSVDWSSATESVATITSGGLASGVAVGTSTISASLDGVSASTTLTVSAPVLAALTITPSDPSIANGLTTQFTATGTYTDKSTKDLTSSVDWSSATQSVATITSDGLASGAAVGTSTITAALDGVSASTTFTVTDPVLASLTITPANPSIADGLTEQFTATGTYTDKSTKDLTSSVDWSSATQSVATITNDGLASGAAVGTSTITAALDGVSASTTLTVTAPVLASLTISPADPTVADGLTEQFTATGTYSDKSTKDLTSSVDWSSATESVATITSSGLASGVAVGTSTISASLDGVSASTTLTVSAPVLASLTITPSDPSIANGLTTQFTATGTYSDQSTKDLTSSVDWSSATQSVATITSGGLASGVAVGTSTITAALDGVSASTTLTVTTAQLMSIAVTSTSASVAKGLTTQFIAVGKFSDSSTKVLTSEVTWTSAQQTVATINANGLVAGVATGTSTISANLNGVSGSAVVTVTAAKLMSITISTPSPSITTGLSEQFTAIGDYSDGSTQNLTGQVNWASSNPAIATISGSGVATGVEVGTSTISVALNGVTASSVLNVTAPPTSSVTVVSMQVEPVVLAVRPFLRRTLALVVQFNGALNAQGAQTLGAYTVLAGQVRRAHGTPVVTYSRPVPIRRAIYNSSNNSVILVPRQNVSLPRLEQLMVDVSVVTDPQGRPINNGQNINVKAWRGGLIE